MTDAHEIQLHLSRFGFQPGRIDGLIGPRTRRALAAAGLSDLSTEEAARLLSRRLAEEVVEIPQLTLGQLQALAPKFPAAWVDALNRSLILAHILPSRLPAYLAQLAHESARFATLVEYGNDDYFDKYDGRADLGNTEPGDGLRFKGRGPIQVTGRSNYARYGKLIQEDLISQPERAARPSEGFRLAAMYWLDRGLNHLADVGDFEALTRAINGGTNGLADREAWLEKAQALFSQGAGVEAPAPEEREPPEPPAPFVVPPELAAAPDPTPAALGDPSDRDLPL